MDQQTLFRPPTEEEHRELYGGESAGNGSRMTDVFDGLVKTLRGGGHNNGKRDDTHKQRTLSSKELESLHRTRELRELSIDLGDGECQWTQPTLITETDANDVEATWLAAYPGSGKRLTVKLVEALTGHQVSCLIDCLNADADGLSVAAASAKISTFYSNALPFRTLTYFHRQTL
jgi:hypothetical protein